MSLNKPPSRQSMSSRSSAAAAATPRAAFRALDRPAGCPPAGVQEDNRSARELHSADPMAALSWRCSAFTSAETAVGVERCSWRLCRETAVVAATFGDRSRLERWPAPPDLVVDGEGGLVAR